MKEVVAVGEQAAELARRNLHAPFPQFFQDQRLRDVVLIVLIEHVGPQPGAEMPADAGRQRRGDGSAVGQPIPFAFEARIVQLDLQILDGEFLAAETNGAGRQTGRRERLGFMNDEVFGFGPGGFAARFPVLLWGRLRTGLIEPTGFDGRLVGGLLISAQEFDLRRQSPNHFQQLFNDGRLFFGANLHPVGDDRFLPSHAPQKHENRLPCKDRFSPGF